jgi:hypothetical protein
MIVLLRPDTLTKPDVKEELLKAVEGASQVLVMCHINQAPMVETEVKKASPELQKVMSRLPIFCYSPDSDASCVMQLLERMYFPDWKPTANKSTTFRKNENPLVQYLFQKCEDDVECANALQAIANVTSPSSTNAADYQHSFYRDGGLVILGERLSNFGSVAPICEAGCRVIANLAAGGCESSVECVQKMCDLGMVKQVIITNYLIWTWTFQLILANSGVFDHRIESIGCQ